MASPPPLDISAFGPIRLPPKFYLQDNDAVEATQAALRGLLAVPTDGIPPLGIVSLNDSLSGKSCRL